MSDPTSPGHPFPPGALNVNGFSFFNAVSFQIMLGAPVVLYAKSLGASSLVLGFIASLTPLLTIMQLVAARYLHRTGYRKFVLAGWGTRTFFTLCIALLPIVPGLSTSTRLTLLAVALFAFSFVRGLASGAWLPWMSSLVPENVRGRFLSRDQAFMQMGSLVAMLVSGWVMAGQVEAGEYASVFGIAMICGVASLLFIHRIPEVDSPEALRRSSARVPWAAMMKYAPFARLLIFTTNYMLIMGGLSVFTVEYLVVKQKFTEATILLLSAWAFVGALAGLAISGPRLDVTGSKPWLQRALVMQAGVIGMWFCLAAGVLPGWVGLIGALNLLGGVAGAVFGVANTRIIMSSVPVMGRNHFFALFTVITSLGLGGAPLAWGAVLDTLGTYEVVTGGFSLNRYTIYFAALVVLAAGNLLLARRLHEGSLPDVS
jgi:MFS family permease